MSVRLCARMVPLQTHSLSTVYGLTSDYMVLSTIESIALQGIKQANKA